MLVHVQRGLVWTYDLDLNEIFTADGLGPWCDELRRCNITPDLTWTALTGADEMPHGGTDYTYESKRSTHLEDGWYYPVFVLHFVDGWLRHIELEVRFGASETTGPPVR